MRAFSLAAISVAALALFSSAPTACAAAIEKRDAASEAQSILNNAKDKISPIKEKLRGLLTEDNVSNTLVMTTQIVPTVASINAILAEAAGQIKAIEPDSSSKAKRQVDTQAVADALVALVGEVYEALEPLLAFLGGIPLVANLLGGLLASLDDNLSVIAEGLGTLLGGVLELVRDLLVSLTDALRGFGFLNFLRLIGLIPA